MEGAKGLNEVNTEIRVDKKEEYQGHAKTWALMDGDLVKRRRLWGPDGWRPGQEEANLE